MPVYRGMNDHRMPADDGYHVWLDYSGPDSRCVACGLWFARWSGDPCPDTFAGQCAALRAAFAELWAAVVAVTRIETLADWLNRLATRRGSRP